MREVLEEYKGKQESHRNNTSYGGEISMTLQDETTSLP